MSEEKAKKPFYKQRRFIVLAIIFVCGILNSLAKDSNSSTTQTPTTQKIGTVEKTDAVQERINRINELYTEESSFEKVEKLDTNALGIYFTSTPDLGISDSIDSITRGQAMNLSNEVNGVASVKTFVGGNAQMFCTATKGQVNDCIDYR